RLLIQSTMNQHSTINNQQSTISRSNDGDVREIAVPLGVVEAVADDEAIFDREADVFDLHVDLAPRRLAEEARGAERLRVAAAQNVLQIMQRQSGVDDVFD